MYTTVIRIWIRQDATIFQVEIRRIFHVTFPYDLVCGTFEQAEIAIRAEYLRRVANHKDVTVTGRDILAGICVMHGKGHV